MQDARHLGLRRIGKGRTSLALNQRLQAAHGIVVEAWAPLMKGRVAEEPALVEIAARRGKSPAQVAIRWLLQHGVVTIPKSVHRDRIAENASVFDFALTDADMAAIDAVDRGERFGPEPDRGGER